MIDMQALSTNEMLREYAKCLQSPIYAIENYLETYDKTQEGFVPFKLFPRQKDVISALEKNRFNLVTKPRQAGISTITQAYCAVKACLADDTNPETIIVIANKLNLAKKFVKGIKDYAIQLPRWFWGEDYYGTEEKEKKSIFVKDSQIEVELPNGSKFIAVATSEDALRGYTPTLLIFDEAAFIEKGASLYSAAITSLGCLTKESLILTNNGLVELNELVAEKNKVGFTNLKKPHIICDKNGNLTPATKTFVSEYGETYKLKTKIGLELEGSWKHPILINRNNIETWIKLNELEIGDKIIINYNQNYFGTDSSFLIKNNIKHKNIKPVNIPFNLSENLDFCYLLGLFIAEGNFHNNGITITNTDKMISDFLINDEAKLGRGFTKVNEKHHMFNSVELLNWFEEFGLKKHNAKLKEIPLAILKMPKDVIISFLQGMFDGDGMSIEKEIRYASTSKKLIQTLQVLLLNFGIVSYVRKEIRKTSDSSIIKNKSHICTIYNLKIYSDYAIKFYNEIGFRLERKQKNKKFLIGRKLNSRFVNVSKNTILEVLKNNNKLKSKYRFLEPFFSSKYERMSYESLFRLINEIPNDDTLLKLKEQIDYNNKYYIDAVVEITCGADYTYDLHVPKTNSFISNGIISHNTGGKAVLISTPQGYDELYYKTYEQSLQGLNDYNVIELKWYEDPRYNKKLSWHKGDEVIKETEFTIESYKKKIKEGYKPTSTWYEDMCKGMNNDKKKIAQELDVSFLGSGGNVIDDEFIEYHDRNFVIDPKFVDRSYFDGNSGLVWIWEEPIEGHQYIMANDVSRGDGSDFSTFEIIDFTTMEQVAEFQGKIPPDLFADVIEKYGNHYNALVIVDNIGIGNTTVSKLVEKKYPKLYYEKKGDNPVAGFNINGARIQLIANLEISIRTNIIKIRSKRIINEMKTFIYNAQGKPDHMAGYNNDCLMALGMALWIMETDFKSMEKLQKQTKAILNSWVSGSKVSTTQLNLDKGTAFVSKENRNKMPNTRPKFSPIVSKNMQDPTGQFAWLFSGMK